jgi:hypothetical protein
MFGEARRALTRAAAATLRARAAAQRLYAPAAALPGAQSSGAAVEPAQPLQRCRGCGRRRGFASSATPAAPPLPLKAVLRQLYLRVHPDLFTDAPAEQATNQRSFILLQDYLAATESGGEPTGRAQAFNFEFFIRESAPEEGGEGGGELAAAPLGRGSLRRVSLTLPPPGRRQPGQDAGRRAHAHTHTPGTHTRYG